MGMIADAMKDSIIYAFLENPKIHFGEKTKIMSQRLEGISPLAVNLALLLVTKRRLGIVEELASEYGRLVDEHRGIAHAETTTAIPLDGEAKDRITQRLSDTVAKEILLATKVDPSIIGGLTIRIGDKLIDGSTKSRLLALKKSLVEAAK